MVLFSKFPDIGLIISLSVFLPFFFLSFDIMDNIGVDGNDGSSQPIRILLAQRFFSFPVIRD